MQEVAHPLGLVGHDADSHQRGKCIRRRDLRDEVSTCLGINDHDVIVVFANLVTQLPDCQDLLHRRCRIGDEVEDACERCQTSDHRHPQEQANVFPQ